MKSEKEEFISTLSHEIRTPLTSIKGFCETIISNWDKLDDNKKKEFLKIILEQSKRLINLTENVLNAAKIDSENQNLVLTKIDINKVIEKAIKIVSINYPLFKLNYTKPNNVLYSYCDLDKTQQVILNVLDNALKYSNNSNKIDIELKCHKDYNVISVKNYGSCIDKKDYEKIFEKFYRTDSYLKSSRQGSGLGLYIVKNLLLKMNGDISVSSDKETLETEFKIFLPIWEVEKEVKSFV